MIKKTIPCRLRPALLLILLSLLAASLPGQRERRAAPATTSPSFDERLYNAIQWRHIGPFRGGRSAAVTGVSGKPNLYYMGATGGGVWRTTDGGQHWQCISDGYFGGSIGGVAVAESDHNVIYVGGGEKTVRGNVSYGYGMWKSVDAGKSWQSIGLTESRHIPRVRVHPRNPELVYAAVLGDLFKSSEQRGVYRSKDGGRTWEKVLFVNADAGAIDLLIDPGNPRILYASTWRVRRTPYSLESGGEGSALWKSVDGGDSWVNVSDNKGMPKGPLGIIGVAVSPLNSERVWAIVEANEGGVFRSDDGGKNWTRTNDDRALRQRAWYYTRIYADTQDENGVYVVNVAYHYSADGGRTFKAAFAAHADHHDLWIDPDNNQRMVIANDGGAQVSYDGGQNWSTYLNQPTAQFYRVSTDNHFPYRIYGAQQDNSTIRIAHRNEGFAIGEDDWEATAGGESGHLAVDPLDNDIVYGGSYGGFLTRLNHRTKEIQAVTVWPDNPMGYGAEGMKYRFQWNFPIFFSPHDPKKLYTLSNHVHISYSSGQSWELASEDLTRNDPSKLGPSGGPITKDNTSVEYYCTLFAGLESPYEEGLVWVGSDDGLVHMSRDGGKSWSNVTPPNMPEWMMINAIDADPFVKGGAYVTGTRYKLGDYRPYIYRTKDYGKTWTLIINGIDPSHFTRVTRADPKRQGLLYCGTESGMYISFDDGANWRSFQLNLPMVPITDLALKNDNLIAATQGRSFWLIDDLTVLRQLEENMANSELFLFKPMPSYRLRGGQNKNVKNAGLNHPGGVMTHFYLREKPADSIEVKLSYHHANGELIREFSSKAKEKRDQIEELKAGGNLFVWDMRYPAAKDFEGMIFWAANLAGPRIIPGQYQVRLSVGEASQEQTFEILADPRAQSTPEDLKAQFDFLMDVRDKISEAHQAIIDIRQVRAQLNHYKKLWEGDNEKTALVAQANAIDSVMTKIENELYQTKNRSGQDPLNYPIKLTNKLAHVGALSGYGDFAPTEQARQVKEEMSRKIDEQLQLFRRALSEDLPRFNQTVKDKAVDAVMLKRS
jgi:photosystem II stability/assembly factor-like uncharacterized protein